MNNELTEMILKCHHHGEFILSSGGKDTEYYDLAPLLLDWQGVSLVVHEIRRMFIKMGYASKLVNYIDAYACPELCPVPIVCGLAYDAMKKGLIVRKQAKGHGTNKLIEGNPLNGDNVLVVEDVTSTGASTMKAIRALEEAGCKVFGIVTIINRQEGCDELLKDYNFWWLITKAELFELEK